LYPTALETSNVVLGRTALVRQPNESEIRQTLVIALPLTEASAKVRTGPPVDDLGDMGSTHWAGVIPLHLAAGVPEPDPTLAPGIAFPHAVPEHTAHPTPRALALTVDADCASR